MHFYTVLVMTFEQFRYLSEEDQENLLWQRGVELARSRDAIFHYILYQVDGFYMEVKYILPFNSILQIACFEDVDMLENYLQNINIEPLLML